MGLFSGLAARRAAVQLMVARTGVGAAARGRKRALKSHTPVQQRCEPSTINVSIPVDAFIVVLPLIQYSNFR